MTCPYGGHELVDPTDEHVLPRALGGNLQPTNPFLVRACRRCNGACGRHVDGPLVRDRLLSLARANAAQSFYEPGTNPTVPLQFLGELEGWTDVTTVCDFWLGPTGDSIYHFHRPYDRPETLAGIPYTRQTELDPGSVHIGFLGTHSFWPPAVLRSVVAEFRRARVFAINSTLQGGPTMSAEEQRQRDWIKSSQPAGSEHAFKIALSVRAGARFMAKVALGFGSLQLDPSFLLSDDAQRLRDVLWDKDGSTLEASDLRGKTLWASGPQFARGIDWNGAHLLWATAIGGVLALRLHLYSKFEMQIEVTRNHDHWSGRFSDRIDEGVVWVIQPSLRRFAGPMQLSSFIRHREASTGPLAELKGHIDAAPRFPPFHP